jgi:hypothetical protein
MIALSYFYFVLAVIFNAIMDNVSHHPSQSVFKGVWGGWWIRDWTYKYNVCDDSGKGRPECGRVKWRILGFEFNRPVQITDGWHFSKMCMIFFLSASVASATFSSLPEKSIYFTIGYFTLLGVSWIAFFNLFYNKLLRTNK